MLDDSPADDNGRPYDYADANDSTEDDWEPVNPPGGGLRTRGVPWRTEPEA